jgi:hypothetical protein
VRFNDASGERAGLEHFYFEILNSSAGALLRILLKAWTKFTFVGHIRVCVQKLKYLCRNESAHIRIIPTWHKFRLPAQIRSPSMFLFLHFRRSTVFVRPRRRPHTKVEGLPKIPPPKNVAVNVASVIPFFAVSVYDLGNKFLLLKAIQ